MLPSSVRRVVSTAPQAPAFSLASTVTRPASASFALAYRPSRHQRRCSSSKPSKPSSPENGAAAASLPAEQSVTASKKASSVKAPSEKRKRKAKAEPAHNLPSVPSTQHLPKESERGRGVAQDFPLSRLTLHIGIATASFFSQHRPISITHMIPKTVTDDAFAAIFDVQGRGPRASSEVVDMLSRTVKQLEGPMASLSVQEDGQQQEDDMARIELKHPDGTESSIYVQLNAMQGQFIPFSPPPVPEPASESTSEAASALEEGGPEDEAPSTRVYKAVLTIEEHTDGQGRVQVMAHSPQIVEDPPRPRSFLERMALRHLKYEDAVRQREKMVAISVRRQRKLKMKKQKFKKFMRKTRNQRRRHDRI
jgi:hypothetical protein